MKKNFWKTVVLAGLLVGTLDITAALVNYYIKTGNDPLNVLKYVAGAVVDKEAVAGNARAALGLLLHFLVAFAWTILFFFIYPRLKLAAMPRVLTGILYGIAIWAGMRYLVLPMTKISVGAFNLTPALTEASILICAIGLPLSFIAYNYYRRKF